MEKTKFIVTATTPTPKGDLHLGARLRLFFWQHTLCTDG